MCSLKSTVQTQTCVYWAPLGVESGTQAFDRYGQLQFADPIEKDCRWEDTAETFTNEKGVQESSNALVMVDDVLVGGLLMLGELTDIVDSANPRNNAGVWEIRKKERIPDFRGTIMYEWAYL